MKLAVLGAGAWGTAIAIHLASRHAVTLWARDAAQAAAVSSARENLRYLPGYSLPAAVAVTGELDAALDGSELVLLAVTISGLRDTLQRLATMRTAARPIWLCKGFEQPLARLPHQVCAEVLPGVIGGALSGPSFAEEVARRLPTALTLASSDAAFAADAARALHGDALRVYSSGDIVGVEVAGAVKNVIAIACGICDGLELGLNARAALMTRGLAEVTRLGVALGGRAETFMGLSGVGDLMLTCTGNLSRNRRVGLRLAAGTSLQQILGELGHVAEGVHSAREVLRLARENSVAMPITEAVCRVLDRPGDALRIASELLDRDPRPEAG